MKRFSALILLLLIGTAQAGGVYTNGTISPTKMGSYYTTRTADTPVSGRVQVDFAASQTHTVTVSAATRFYFTPPATTNQPVMLELTNSGGSAGYTFLPSPEVSTITTVADVAGSLDGTYFLIYDTGGSVCVWYDVDDNGTAEPGGACSAATRDLEVTTVVTGDSAALVATATKLKLDADAQYVATVVSSTVTVVDVVSEARTDIIAGTSGFTVAVTYAGSSTTMTWVGGSEPTWDTSNGILNLVRCVWDGTNYTACENTVGAGSSFSGVSVGPSPAYILMAPSVLSVLPLNGAEEWETDSYHAGLDDFVTIPAAGKYEVNLIFSYYGIHPYSWDLYLVKNDPGNDCVAPPTTLAYAQGPMPPLPYLTSHTTPIYFGIYSLAAGDTLILCVQHNYTAASDFAVFLFQATRR